jgi:hypothetical protein
VEKAIREMPRDAEVIELLRFARTFSQRFESGFELESRFSPDPSNLTSLAQSLASRLFSLARSMTIDRT